MLKFNIIFILLLLLGCSNNKLLCNSVKSIYKDHCEVEQYGNILYTNFTAYQRCIEDLNQCQNNCK